MPAQVDLLTGAEISTHYTLRLLTLHKQKAILHPFAAGLLALRAPWQWALHVLITIMLPFAALPSC
jgi:hypothetical protein